MSKPSSTRSKGLTIFFGLNKAGYMKKNPNHIQRNNSIERLRHEGCTYAEIGETFGLSNERIRIILNQRKRKKENEIKDFNYNRDDSHLIVMTREARNYLIMVLKCIK